MKTKSRTIPFLLLAASLFLPLPAQFPGAGEGPARPSIKAEALPGQAQLLFRFSLDGRYHITDLKNNFFAIELERNEWAEISKVVFPPGEPYGDEMVFKGHFSVPVELKVRKATNHPLRLRFAVSYQICQERPEELCFAPDQEWLEVTLPSLGAPAGGAGGAKPVAPAPVQAAPAAEAAAIAAPAAAVPGPTPAVAPPAASDRGKPTTAAPVPAASRPTLVQRVTALIGGGPGRSLPLALAGVFLLGFLTSLTPCVYPVIPLVMGFIGSFSGGSKRRGFTLSLVFVLGLAIVYSVLGVVAAMGGAMLGVSFQNPWVVSVIAAVFILMGLSLAGLFDIPVPAGLSARIGRGYRSRFLTAFVVGGVSGVIAAPCAGPVLISILSYISQTRDVLLGFLMTFAYALGMSVIFVLVGTFSGVLTALPRGGRWMETVKHLFAALLLAGGLLFLGTILPAWLNLALWGAFLVAAAVWLGLFRPAPEEEGGTARLLRVAALLLLLAGALLFWKGLERRWFPAPAAPSPARAVGLAWERDLDAALRRARAENRRLLLDFYADWCKACVELDELTWPQPEVRAALASYIPVKLDFTRAGDPAAAGLKKRFRVIGMPTVVVLGADGQEQGRFSGFLDPAGFLAFLQTLR